MKTWLLLASAFTLFAAPAQAGPAPGAGNSDAGSSYSFSGTAYDSGVGPIGDNRGVSPRRDGQVRCQNRYGHLMLVNASGAAFPAHAALRYTLGDAPARSYVLSAPLRAGDAVVLSEPVRGRFNCVASVRF